MAESRVASAVDRLPWLADDRPVAPRRKPRILILPLVVALLAIAAASYWLGWRVSDDKTRFDGRPASRSTVALPQPQEIQPEMPALPEQVDVTPVPLPPMPEIAQPEPVRIAPTTSPARPAKVKHTKRAASRPTKKGVEKVKAEQSKPTYTTTPWPVRVEEGAAGRLVRIGTFSSRRLAKRGWNVLMRNNPSLQRLPALVVPVQSARNGKTYYRLQMGTSSQAHSTVLCQRMRMIGQSCVIVAGGPVS